MKESEFNAGYGYVGILEDGTKMEFATEEEYREAMKENEFVAGRYPLNNNKEDK